MNPLPLKNVILDLRTKESMKVCKTCQLSKSLDEYYANRKECKSCLSQRRASSQAVWYQNNKERLQNVRATYRENNKEKYQQEVNSTEVNSMSRKRH